VAFRVGFLFWRLAGFREFFTMIRLRSIKFSSPLRRFAVAAVVSFSLGGSLEFATAETTEFVTPPWARGSATNSTYQEWDVFQSNTDSPPNTTPSGAIPVDAFPSPSTATPTVAAPPFNPNGTASAVPGPSGVWLLSSGNIYSPFLTSELDAFVPNYNLDTSATPAGWTTLIMQVRTSGSLLDLNSVKLTGFNSANAALAGQTLVSPAESALRYTSDSVIPQGATTTQDNWFEFHVPGNAAKYQLELAGSGTSTSIQQLSIDSIYTLAATPIDVPAPALVPEPSTFVLAGFAVCGGFLFMKRRSNPVLQA
jgi:hypothetical protein